MTTWELPPTDLLSGADAVTVPEDCTDALLEALARLGAPCNEESATVAPQAVRYELVPCDGVRMKAFRGIEEDLMQRLSVDHVRIEAPTPGRHTIGIELPRKNRAIVYLGDVVPAASKPLSAAVGVDMNGRPVVLPIAEFPHLLIAGRSGGGKSVLLHSILCSLLATHTPDELELIIVDPKSVEGAMYEGLPHASNVVYDAHQAIGVLWGMVEQMETTYRCMRRYGARDLDELNAQLALEGEQPIPRRLCVIDEAADLMMQSKSRVESAMVRLGQKGRAAGFHVIVATQSPRANVITGLLKANLPARIALATSSALDSRIILDQNGAEHLLGRGDALIDDGISGTLQRFQTAWAPSSDVEAMVDWWRSQNHALVAA